MWQGMQATVRCDEDGERGERLVMSGPKPAYVGASDAVLKRLDAEGTDLEVLTAVSPLTEPFPTPDAQPETEADRLLKSFIGINGTWRIFATGLRSRRPIRPPTASKLGRKTSSNEHRKKSDRSLDPLAHAGGEPP